MGAHTYARGPESNPASESAHTARAALSRHRDKCSPIQSHPTAHSSLPLPPRWWESTRSASIYGGAVQRIPGLPQTAAMEMINRRYFFPAPMRTGGIAPESCEPGIPQHRTHQFLIHQPVPQTRPLERDLLACFRMMTVTTMQREGRLAGQSSVEYQTSPDLNGPAGEMMTKAQAYRIINREHKSTDIARKDWAEIAKVLLDGEPRKKNWVGKNRL